MEINKPCFIAISYAKSGVLTLSINEEIAINKLTNIRASGSDEAVRLVPPIELSLEAAIEFIADDELVEVTPKTIRLRKRLLTELERRRAGRA